MRFQLSMETGLLRWLPALVLVAGCFSCSTTSPAIDAPPVTGQGSPGRAIGRATAPVVIDGRLDDAAWRSALTFDHFTAVGSEAGQPSPSTIARLMYDEHAMLISFRCEEPDPSRIKANISQHDGKVWAEDCVELFLDVTGAGHSYAHLAINTRGVIYDAWREAGQPADIGWNSHAQAAAVVDETGWRVEIRLPWDRLPPGWASSAWRIQLGRSRTSRPRHLTMLSSPITGFHVPNQFELMQGMQSLQRLLRASDVSLGDRLPGRNIAQFVAENRGSIAQPVTASLWLGSQRIAQRHVTIPPQQRKAITLPYSLAMHSRERIRLTIENDGHALGSLDQPALPVTIIGVKDHQIMMTQPHERAVLSVPISLASDSLASATLRWKLINPAGQVCQQGTAAVDAGKAMLALEHAQAGRHELQLTLAWDERSRLERRIALYLVPGPFAP